MNYEPSGPIVSSSLFLEHHSQGPWVPQFYDSLYICRKGREPTLQQPRPPGTITMQLPLLSGSQEGGTGLCQLLKPRLHLLEVEHYLSLCRISMLTINAIFLQERVCLRRFRTKRAPLLVTQIFRDDFYTLRRVPLLSASQEERRNLCQCLKLRLHYLSL